MSYAFLACSVSLPQGGTFPCSVFFLYSRRQPHIGGEHDRLSLKGTAAGFLTGCCPLFNSQIHSVCPKCCIHARLCKSGRRVLEMFVNSTANRVNIFSSVKRSSKGEELFFAHSLFSCLWLGS